MKRSTLAAEWQMYESQIPSGASEEQRLETKRAFYAGAGMMFNLCTDVGRDHPPGPLSESQADAEVVYLESLQAEVREFVALVAVGAA